MKQNSEFKSDRLKMSKQEWILLNFRPSMFGARVRIALEEKEIDFEYREEDLVKGKSALLLEMNPVFQKIPVLIHNGKPICESLNIVEYIDEVCKDGNGSQSLLPSDPHEKAQARFWADFIDKKLQVSGMKVTYHKNQQELEEGEQEVLHCLKLLEEVLAEKPYFGGEAIGYLDVVLGGYCSWLFTYDTFGNLGMENECPNLTSWAKRCMERSSFSKSLMKPIELVDFVVKARKIRGLD